MKGERRGLSATEAIVALRHAIAAAGGIDELRASKEKRRAFIDRDYATLLRRIDGRAARALYRELMLAFRHPLFVQMEQAKRDERRLREAKRRAKLRPKAAKRRTRAPSHERPVCASCGATDRLLDASGRCVNRSRCACRIKGIPKFCATEREGEQTATRLEV